MPTMKLQTVEMYKQTAKKSIIQKQSVLKQEFYKDLYC